jgi:hypothetical protein
MGAAASVKLIYADALAWYKQVSSATYLEETNIGDN